MSETNRVTSRRFANKKQTTTPPNLASAVDDVSDDSTLQAHVHINETNSEVEETEELNKRLEEHNHREKERGLHGDRYNVALLTFLYILQGIPLGLSGSVPYLLQSRKVNYKDQAMFSFVYWPFSLKLLWAPIVDSVYSSWFGRRKSWLVPTQYLIGLFMLVLSLYIHDLLEGDNVNVLVITIVFFMLNFLAATQDIAVDGWALTMLARRNVGWASTCNTVGQTAGFFLGYVVFMALESANFCNDYLRAVPQPYGMINLADFLYMWSVVFLLTTTLVMIFKRERGMGDPQEEPGIVDTYMQLVRIIKLPSILSLISILLTVKMGFAAADAITGLKLIEEGVPRDRLALLGIPMVPIQIILPIIITRYTAGPRPMHIFLKAMPYRLFMGLVFAWVVWWAPSTRTPSGEYPLYFYCVVLASYALHQVALYSMFVAMMAFFAKISDPLIGGTYMTLLNTISNLGGNWPSTLVLWLVDGLTWKTCSGFPDLSCSGEEAQKMCSDEGGQCEITIDGYYVLVVICTVIGLVWLRLRSRTVRHLEELGPQEWTSS